MSEAVSTVAESQVEHLQGSDPFQSLCRQSQIKWSEQQCQKKNPIKFICVDEGCEKNTFICDLETCSPCYQAHILCKTVKLVAFTKLLEKMTQYQKGFFKKLYKVEGQVVKRMEDSRQELAQMISYGSLDQQSIEILKIVTGKKQIDKFIGKKADQLWKKLKTKSVEKNQNEDQLEQIYSKISHKMIDENMKLKRQIFDYFLKGTRPNNLPPSQEDPYFLESDLLTLHLSQLYMNTPEFFKNRTYKKYGCLDLPHEDRKKFEVQQMEYLKTSLSNPKKAELLFRASQHNFQSAAFHQKCDGKAHTLTIFRTQFRKTIFVYSGSAAWNSQNQYVNCGSGRACIVSLYPRNKFLNNGSSTIYCHPIYGPTFGGHDIYIQNGGAVSVSFPVNYNNGLSANQSSYTLMIGNHSGNACKLLEYEVHQLTF